jgi:hypothetical protein
MDIGGAVLHITLGPGRVVDPRVDELGRERVGYDDTMTEAELYEANRGCWVLGGRADREQFALFSFNRVVRQAIAIDRLVETGARRAIEGFILGPGHLVFDAYVGKETPIGIVRNPITYFDSAVGRRSCACGCGAEVAKGYFLPGHDQRAIHDRIARVGSVVDFLDWFDTHYATVERD